jgi:hypothetical protein
MQALSKWFGSSKVLSRSARAAALAACFSLVVPAQAVTVVGHDYAEQASVAGKTLVLNGAGVRQVAWIQAYTAGLYTARRISEGAALMADAGAKRLRIRVLMEVSSEEFVKAFDGGVQKRASPELQAKLAERMQTFDAQVRALGTIKKTDIIDLDYLPGRGLQLAMNQQPRGEPIEGADFYAALLDIFIGERALDRKLRDSLLGAKAG